MSLKYVILSVPKWTIGLVSVVFVICLVQSLKLKLYDKLEEESTEKASLIRSRGPLQQDDPRLLKLIRSSFIDEPSSKPYNLSRDDKYKFQNRKFGQTLSSIIKQLFSDQKGGFFVEAGALDGEFLSNTLWLEKERGWTGLLVEPNPQSYRKLRMKNRRAWTSKTCLSTKPYPFQTTFVGLSVNTVNRRSRNEGMIFKGASHLLGVDFPKTFSTFFSLTDPSYYTVQCLPLTSLLMALNRTEVDFMSIDIQGSEREVLETIPFDKIHVKAVIVEHYAPHHPDPALVKYFSERGLKLIACFGEPDYIFISRKDFENHDFPEITTTSSTFNS